MGSEMSDWLQLFGLDMKKFIGSSYTRQSHHVPHRQSLLASQFSMSVGLLNQQQESEENLKRPNLLKGLKSLSLAPERLHCNLNHRLASRSSSFGQGMLVSDLDGLALVT